jgi:hypothetical protein
MFGYALRRRRQVELRGECKTERVPKTALPRRSTVSAMLPRSFRDVARLSLSSSSHSHALQSGSA